jgi:hypothetical protein
MTTKPNRYQRWITVHQRIGYRLRPLSPGSQLTDAVAQAYAKAHQQDPGLAYRLYALFRDAWAKANSYREESSYVVRH